MKYFEGTPIPTSIVIVLLLGIAMWLGRTDGALPLGVVRSGPPCFTRSRWCMALSGSAMISATLRIPKP